MSSPINQQKEIEALRVEVARLTETNIRLTEANKALEIAAHNATHDDLTGLHNNRWLRQYWDGLGDTPQAEIKAVLMIDGDGVKRANDRYGHDAGDKVIQHLANAIRGTRCPAIRRGGDEFLVLIPRNVEDPFYVVDCILLDSRLPVPGRDGDVVVTVSVGVALVRPEENIRLSDLINNADAAMYRAKALGGDRAEIFH